jgi:hypothetical protein
MASDDRNDLSSGPTGRDRYRDNDDVRAPVAPDQRTDPHPDSKAEARGDARENVGNHARGTAAEPTEGGNDRTANAPRKDEFSDDL